MFIFFGEQAHLTQCKAIAHLNGDTENRIKKKEVIFDFRLLSRLPCLFVQRMAYLCANLLSIDQDDQEGWIRNERMALSEMGKDKRAPIITMMVGWKKGRSCV